MREWILEQSKYSARVFANKKFIVSVHAILIVFSLTILIAAAVLFKYDTWHLLESSSSRTIHMFKNALGEQILMIYNPLAYVFNITMIAIPGLFILFHALAIFLVIKRGSKFLTISSVTLAVLCAFVYLLVWVAGIHDDVPYRALKLFYPRVGL